MKKMGMRQVKSAHHFLFFRAVFSRAMAKLPCIIFCFKRALNSVVVLYCIEAELYTNTKQKQYIHLGGASVYCGFRHRIHAIT